MSNETPVTINEVLKKTHAACMLSVTDETLLMNLLVIGCDWWAAGQQEVRAGGSSLKNINSRIRKRTKHLGNILC